MYEILKLIRIPTIAFAVLTMYAMRYLVIRPMLDINGFSLQMTDWAFSLLIVAVCCLISGAYVINDYFDTKSDRISGIKEVVIGKSISRRVAISLHTVLNLVAVSIAFYLGFAVGIWKIGILFLLVSGILWFYSSTYKKYFLAGNLLVGILASLITFSAIVYEIPLLNMAYAELLIETGTNFLYMFNWIFGFAWFIFLNTLMYEINKDIYTVEGDRENGNHTIPVKLGIRAAERIIAALAGIAMISAVLVYFIEFSASLTILTYIIIAVLFPYGIYISSILSTKRKRCFQLRLIRLIMVLCLGVSVFLRHFFLLIFAD